MFLIEFRFPGLLSTRTTGGAQVQFLASTTTLLTSHHIKEGKEEGGICTWPTKITKTFYTPVAKLPKSGENDNEKDKEKQRNKSSESHSALISPLHTKTFPSSTVVCLHPKLWAAVP